MTHFVAFTYGKFRGARIAFHSVPMWQRDGELVQPLDSVGDVSLSRRIGGVPSGAARRRGQGVGLAVDRRRGTRHQLTWSVGVVEALAAVVVDAAR